MDTIVVRAVTVRYAARRFVSMRGARKPARLTSRHPTKPPRTLFFHVESSEKEEGRFHAVITRRVWMTGLKSKQNINCTLAYLQLGIEMTVFSLHRDLGLFQRDRSNAAEQRSQSGVMSQST
jgi:hypothetical protein